MCARSTLNLALASGWFIPGCDVPVQEEALLYVPR